MTFLTGKIPNPDFFQTSVSLYLLLCSLTLMRNHLMRGWSKFLNLYLIPVVYLYNKKFKSRNHGLSWIFYQSLKWTANLKKGPIVLLTLLAAEGHLYLLSHLSVSFWDQMISPKALRDSLYNVCLAVTDFAVCYFVVTFRPSTWNWNTKYIKVISNLLFIGD